jgi:hypothetical protein
VSILSGDAELIFGISSWGQPTATFRGPTLDTLELICFRPIVPTLNGFAKERDAGRCKTVTNQASFRVEPVAT